MATLTIPDLCTQLGELKRQIEAVHSSEAASHEKELCQLRSELRSFTGSSSEGKLRSASRPQTGETLCGTSRPTTGNRVAETTVAPILPRQTMAMTTSIKILADTGWSLPNAVDDIKGATHVEETASTQSCASITSVDLAPSIVSAERSLISAERPAAATLCIPEHSTQRPRTPLEGWSLTNLEPTVGHKPSLRASAALKKVVKVAQTHMALNSAAKCFAIRAEWNLTPEELARIARKTRKASMLFSNRLSANTAQTHARLKGQASGYYGTDWFIIHPASRTRLFWDLAACFILMYDLALIPMRVFELPDDPFLTFMDVMTVLYWSFDIGMSFITGIYVGAETELRFKIVARNYLRSWFGFDVFVVLPEWLIIIIQSATASEDLEAGDGTGAVRAVRVARFLRFMRYLRLARFLRLWKFRNILQDLKERCNHEIVHMAISVAKIVAVLLIVSHVLACSWYGVGNHPSGWIHSPGLGGSEDGIATQSLGRRYIFSFQFALSRLHPSNMSENMALNSMSERLFSILATVNAMIVTSVFISHITNRMADVKKFRQERDQKLTLIREYAAKHNISTHLSMHLKKYIDTGYAAKMRGLDEAELMKILPRHLHLELMHETWSPVLSRHGFFHAMNRSCLRTEVDICFRTTKEVPVFPGETVFATGDACSRMTFVVQGRLAYLLGFVREEFEQDFDDEDASVAATPSNACRRAFSFQADDLLESEYVGSQAWFCEATLWTPAWENCGEMRAVESGSLVHILASEFISTMQGHQKSLVDAVHYARDFIRRLNENVDRLTDLADVPYSKPSGIASLTVSSLGAGRMTGLAHAMMRSKLRG